MADREKFISSLFGFGEIGHEITEREINNSAAKRQPHVKYSPEERYKIGKHAGEMAQLPLWGNFNKDFRI